MLYEYEKPHMDIVLIFEEPYTDLTRVSQGSGVDYPLGVSPQFAE